ncbi:MAG: hypothetical protein SCARUB_01451 [Candidatus Scalindua rubra]|uniref:Transglutaminase-like domain-containing protein n=1 Tax=Candidatus Scalindua rubra TaxID=1872076 RepID=A0A1E3XEP3_9BACT|nr:MAG: hypothetical protein SCARUB_01451 [Candidatus Scalindua rubra]
MTKRLKIITSLVYTFIMLSSFNLSFTIGSDQPDPSSPARLNDPSDTARAGEVEQVQEPEGEWLLPERLGQAGSREGKAILVGITNTSECFFTDNFSKHGFKPVPDECPYLDNSGKLYDNFMYREWCEETFDNGKYIYEAYKDIAFNIKYTPEPAKTDIWQTPFETIRSKKGDCEDAVFLFFSHLPSKQKNAMITWGWVNDKGSRVARAHVWYQLIDKGGQQYIVEAFSKDWDGIIPIGIVEETESRRPIFTITHSEVCRLASLTSKPDSWHTYQSLIDLCESANFIDFYSRNINISQGMDTQNHLDYEVIEYLLNTQSKPFENTTAHRYPTSHKTPPVMGKEISNILEKLHGLFTRCERQRENFGSNLQIGTSTALSINPEQTRP